MNQKGFTLVEIAAVVFVTAAILAIFVKVFSFQTLSATGKADQIYLTSAAMARNWQQLALAANAPTSQGGVAWTTSNPLFACAASSCATSGNNPFDAQRVVRVLAEGPSAMNPAYVSAWTNSGLTPMSNVLRKNPGNQTLYLMGDYEVYAWGNGSNGSSGGWAMGPFAVRTCLPDDVATVLAWKYYGLPIIPSTFYTAGPFHVAPVADPTFGCGPGVRQTVLIFQV